MAIPPLNKSDLPESIEATARTVIGCAIEVHGHLGPGLLESLYEQALEYELSQAGLRAERQVEIRVPYKSILLEPQRIDLIVERTIVVEIKSIRALEDVHRAQTLSYLRMTGLPLGLLINFNHSVLRDGLKRIINERSSLCLNPSSSLRDLIQ